MSLQRLYGALSGSTAPVVPSWTGGTYGVASVVIVPVDALAGFEIDADGGVERFRHSGNQGDVGRWDGGGSFNKIDYQFRYDGDDSLIWSGGDDFNVWLPASASLDTFACAIDTGQDDLDVFGTLRMRLAVSPFTEYGTKAAHIFVNREF